MRQRACPGTATKSKQGHGDARNRRDEKDDHGEIARRLASAPDEQEYRSIANCESSDRSEVESTLDRRSREARGGALAGSVFILGGQGFRQPPEHPLREAAGSRKCR